MNKEQKTFFISLSFIFLVISIIHVLYAAYIQRGLYMDGSVYFIKLLNIINSGQWSIPVDINHPRFCVLAIQSFPTLILGNLFGCSNKYALSFTYSLTQFGVPLLLLFWNYRLTKRTRNKAIFFFALLEYCLIILLFEIFSVVETIIGVQVYFLILNYLFAKCSYTKIDKIGIIFLLITLFGIYEHTIIIGVLFFIGMFLALKEKPLTKEQIFIKLCIGITALCSSLYTFIFAALNSNEHSDFARFLIEATDIWPICHKFNMILSIITIIFLSITLFKKKISLPFLTLMILIYFITLKHMTDNLGIYLSPIPEGHARSINCYFDCFLILGFLCGKFFKIPEQKDLIQRCYIPVLLCGISLTFWQIVNSYYFDINIKYFKTALNNCNGTLFIPEEHDEVSSFFNKDLRRYIWHGNYSTTALAITKDYKIKTMPLHYNHQDFANNPFREYLYSIPAKNIVCLPYYVFLPTKSKFWDMSDFAAALDKYNRENDIKTADKNQF